MYGRKDHLDKGSGGFTSLYKENRKNVLQSSQNYKCQKCLQVLLKKMFFAQFIFYPYDV